MRFTRISGVASGDAQPPLSALEMLQGCHSRIRHFVQLSLTLADADGAPPKEIADAATALFRYFNDALPLHEADENQTLFPRLIEALPQGGLVSEAAQTMVDQHGVIDELAAELLTLCASLSRQPERLPSLARRLNYVSQALAQIFATHLNLEETVIFPAAQELLTPAQMDQMSLEMHQRREPPFTTIHRIK